MTNSICNTCNTCGSTLEERKITMQKITWTVKNETLEFGVKVNTKCCPNDHANEMIIKVEDMMTFGEDVVFLTKELCDVDSKRKLNMVVDKINERQQKYTLEIVA